MFESQKSAVSKALSHPLRRAILASMPDEGDGVSPNIISKEMNEPLTNVSYHVRMLADLEMITSSGTTPRRGALEHYYVRTPLGQKAAKISKMMEKEFAKP